MNNTKWITFSDLPVPLFPDFDNMSKSIYFRKEFSIGEAVKKAVLSICPLGLGVCTVNGKAVTDEVLSTPYTQYDKRVIYRVYDITSLICPGENTIGVHVGNGFYNDNMSIWNDMMAPWKDNPKLAAKLDITLESGETLTLRTDKTWKTTYGDSVYNHMRQGEWCDARLRQLGYDMPGFDDSSWENACIANEPGGALQTTDMPPIRIIRSLKAAPLEDGVYDFGENTSGWAKITVTGEAGREIRIKYFETFDVQSQNQIKRFCENEGRLLKHEDVFVCSGREKEEFAPSFCYHGFRYIQVENAPDDFSAEAQVVHTDLKTVGSFWCSDEFLNKVHEASVRSTLTNYHGIPTDCPHREQNGWTGDALCSCEQALLNFDMYSAYSKWFDDFKDAQRPSGQLPGVIPTAGFGFDWGSGPAWDSALILMPWQVYKVTGKTGIMEKMWENMVRYMGYCERMSTEWIADFGLGDYLSPDANFRCPPDVTSTAFFYADCLTMAKIARIIGKESSIWLQKAECIREAWRSEFLERKDLHAFQTFYACGLYFGLFNEDEKPEMTKKLVKLIEANGHRTTSGMLGMKWMFSALTENGCIDVLYKMISNPEKPSFAYWINNGATTLCEGWAMKGSQNHHLHSEIDHWMYRYLGGIRFEDDGLVIEPVYVDFIDEVNAEHCGIRAMRKGKNVTVTLPCNAKVRIGATVGSYDAGTYEFSF